MKKRGKSTKVRNFLRPALCLLLSAILVLPSILPANAEKKSDFNIELSYGFDGKVEALCHIPVNITIENLGDNFDGRVQVIVPSEETYDNPGPTMYEKDLNIASGAKKTVSLTLFAHAAFNSMNVRIVNSKEKVLAEKYVTISPLSTINSVNIGVLSDDFSALSYFNRIPLIINYAGINVNSQLLELTAETFPEDHNALDMMDILLISNFSTDKLSAAQLSAIDLWVHDGGTLLIGTGSTYNKVMSGLKDIPSFSDVKASSKITYEKHNTYYGLSICDPTLFQKQVYADSNYSYKSWEYNTFLTLPSQILNEFYSRLDEHLAGEPTYKSLTVGTAEFGNMVGDFFLNNEDFLRKNLSSYFLDYTPSDAEWNDWASDQLFKYIFSIMESLYPVYVAKGTSGDISGIDVSQVSSVNAEIANITVPSSTVTLEGEDLDTKTTFALTKAFTYGSGVVAVAGIDFTQNPLISFSYKAELAKVIIKSNLPGFFFSELNSYQPNYYTQTVNTKAVLFRDVYNQLQSASIPPVLLYTFLLVVYLISIFVSYAKLKKKGKSILFWATQAISAFVFSLLILLFSLSTRLHRAELRTASFNYYTPGASATSEFSELVMPKKKKYTVELADSHNPERISDPTYSYRYYYSNTSSSSLDDYHLAIHEKAQSTEFRVNNTTPLSSESFISGYTSVAKNGGFSVAYDSTDRSVSITNNTGKDLEKAYIVVYNLFYPLDNIADGETKVVSQSSVGYMYPQETGQYYSYYATGYFNQQKNPIYTYLLGNNSVSFRELFIGSNNSAFIERRLPLAFYSSVINNYWRASSEQILIGGQTKNPETTGLQAENKAKEFTFEYHIQQYELDLISGKITPVEYDPTDGFAYQTYYY